MKKTATILVLALLLTTLASAAEINNLEIEDQIFEEGAEVEITANTTDAEDVAIDIQDPNNNVMEQTEMTLVDADNSFEIWEFNYTVEESTPGYWEATINATNSDHELATDSFFVAIDEPIIKSQSETPSVVAQNDTVTIDAEVTHSEEDIEQTAVDIYNETRDMDLVNTETNLFEYELDVEARQEDENPYTVTATDSTGDFDEVENSFHVFEDEDDLDVVVDIAPTCGSSLDFFLMPGDGQVVQNRTGTFVQILSNSGNIQSDIEVEELDITFEGDSEWQPGDDIGESIASNPPFYDGEFFPEVRMGESVTYFELFNANHDLGNYTARSSISTECLTEGPQQQEENITQLQNEGYTCENTEQEEFDCFNETVYDTNLRTVETTTENLTTQTSEDITEQVTEKRENTTSFTSSMTLNATDYDAYTFNASNTLNYDYACIIPEGENNIDEDRDCAYEGTRINEYMIEVQEVVDDTGQEASFGFQEENEDMLNTTLTCDGPLAEHMATCNYTLEFFETFNPTGNFEIVETIGEEEGDEGDEPEPGDDPDDPGETEVPDPEPEPVPDPVPEPEPEPEISVRLDALNDTVETRQTQFAEATFEIENVGNVNLTNVSITPEQMLDDWTIEQATVNSLNVGETTTRDVFIEPGMATEPGSYVVPTRAMHEDGRELALDYFEMEVLPADLITELSIEETAQTIQVPVEEETEIPILIENTGEENLTNIDARLQNVEDCGTTTSTTVEQLEEDEQGDITLTVQAGENTESCETTMIVSSEEGAFAFSDLELTVIPEEALIPEEQRVPLIAILWTLALVLYAFATRKYELDSLRVKLPYILLIAGEVIIILYIAINFYNLPGEHLLPF